MFDLHVSFCMCHSACVILHVSFCMCHSACVILHVSFCMCHSACVILHVSFCMCHSACVIQHVSFWMWHFDNYRDFWQFYQDETSLDRQGRKLIKRGDQIEVDFEASFVDHRVETGDDFVVGRHRRVDVVLLADAGRFQQSLDGLVSIDGGLDDDGVFLSGNFPMDVINFVSVAIV